MSRKRSVRPVEVFISYSSKNLNFAARLVDVLGTYGVRSFLSRRSIRGAQEWHDEIGAALKRCDWFLVILSPDSVRSKWIRRELTYALRADRYNDRIIPVLYKTCDVDELSWALSAQQVDFRRSFDQGCQDLLNIWRLPYRSERTHKPG
ncbi:MAG TPA: toll/interleukin-1 receptor domain-containing protein [Bryobacteraceae bacterium]|nr:toll/interleukin-1 receptor domain-containing protein [Bryobacteraceae bacterium]